MYFKTNLAEWATDNIAIQADKTVTITVFAPGLFYINSNQFLVLQ